MSDTRHDELSWRRGKWTHTGVCFQYVSFYVRRKEHQRCEFRRKKEIGAQKTISPLISGREK